MLKENCNSPFDKRGKISVSELKGWRVRNDRSWRMVLVLFEILLLRPFVEGDGDLLGFYLIRAALDYYFCTACSYFCGD